MDPNIPTQTPPTQPVIPSNKIFKVSKPIFISLLVALAIAIPATGYFLSKNQPKPTSTVQPSPTPTPDLNREPTGSAATANWKKYSNGLIGFILKYPDKELVACDPTAQKQLNLWKAPFDCPDGHDVLYEVSVNVRELAEYTPIKKASYSEKITIDGIDATKNSYIFTDEDGPLSGLEGTEVLIPVKNSYIEIFLLGKESKQKERFNLILSTFKFE